MYDEYLYFHPILFLLTFGAFAFIAVEAYAIVLGLVLAFRDLLEHLRPHSERPL